MYDADAYQIYCGDHFLIYLVVKSVWCTHNTLPDITLIYPNCILFQCNSHRKSDNVFLIMYFSQWVSSKESTGKAGDLGSIPGLGRYPGEGRGNPLQYSCLENLMDRGAWQLTVVESERVGDNWCDWACTCIFE